MKLSSASEVLAAVETPSLCYRKFRVLNCLQISSKYPVTRLEQLSKEEENVVTERCTLFEFLLCVSHGVFHRNTS